MSRPSREAVMNALLTVLQASVQTKFIASTQSGSNTLYSPNTISSLFIGLPVFGGSVPRGAIITSVSPLMVSEPATANGSDICFTTGFQTTGRRLKHWSQVAAQPALYLRDPDEELEYQNNILQVQTIKAEIWVYSNAGKDPDAVPVTALNNLLDAIQTAMAPDDPTQMRFTLGGLVFWCRLEGKIEKEPGDASGQAVAVADVLITVP